MSAFSIPIGLTLAAAFASIGMRHRFYQFEALPIHVSSRMADSRAARKERIWPRFLSLLLDLAIANVLTTHAFVLMSNHFHLLCSSRAMDLRAAMGHLFERLSPWYGVAPDGQHQPQPILDFHQYRQVYKYIYRNPVEAGLVNKVQQYPYSTIRCLLGDRSPPALVEDPFGFIFDPVRALEWLNQKDLVQRL